MVTRQKISPASSMHYKADAARTAPTPTHSTHPFLLGAYNPCSMKTQVRNTAAMMVTTHPATILTSSIPFRPRRPSHRPTPAMAPTVAGVEDMGMLKRDAMMTTAATHTSTQKPAYIHHGKRRTYCCQLEFACLLVSGVQRIGWLGQTYGCHLRLKSAQTERT